MSLNIIDLNLIIDQGNTIAKVAVFEKNIIIEKTIYEDLSSEILLSLGHKYNIENVIISSVKKIEGSVIEKIQENFLNLIYLNQNTSLPFKIGYKTPNTLGVDRIAAIAGAEAEKEDSNIIVIDAGTAITYDFMDRHKVYRGGNIAPGMQMRFKSLNEFTDALPLVDKTGELPDFGNTTQTAIRCGVIKGLVYEIEGFIEEMQKKYDSVFVFLTGGDAFFLSENINYPIFVDKNLVLKGLNRILNYNVEK